MRGTVSRRDPLSRSLGLETGHLDPVGLQCPADLRSRSPETTLELANVGGQWDHTHGMILSTASIAADFRVLDGGR